MLGAAARHAMGGFKQEPAQPDIVAEEQAKASIVREGLAREQITEAYEKGTLGEGRVFSSMDAAAKEVLSVSGEISSANNVELGGFLFESGDGFTYGRPMVGLQSTMPQMVDVPTGAVAGYHTHPGGGQFFSMGDANWVNGKHGTGIPLYLSAGGQVRVCGGGQSCNPQKAMYFTPNKHNPALQGSIVK